MSEELTVKKIFEDCAPLAQSIATAAKLGNVEASELIIASLIVANNAVMEIEREDHESTPEETEARNQKLYEISQEIDEIMVKADVNILTGVSAMLANCATTLAASIAKHYNEDKAEEGHEEDR